VRAIEPLPSVFAGIEAAFHLPAAQSQSVECGQFQKRTQFFGVIIKHILIHYIHAAKSTPQKRDPKICQLKTTVQFNSH
jgi:hypothetical protein